MFRYDIINHFIKKYNFNKYLEIGVCSGDCIRRVQCNDKDGIDSGDGGWIVPETNYAMTSDAFFAQNEKIYDIVFIDGLHYSDQVDRDIENSLKYTSEFGIIILHDCNPPTYEHSIIPFPGNGLAWNGDVYKSVLKFQKNNKQHTFFTVDTDWGVGVIIKNVKSDNNVPDVYYDSGVNDWEYFDANRHKLLNLITPKKFLETLYENN